VAERLEVDSSAAYRLVCPIQNPATACSSLSPEMMLKGQSAK